MRKRLGEKLHMHYPGAVSDNLQCQIRTAHSLGKLNQRVYFKVHILHPFRYTVNNKSLSTEFGVSWLPYALSLYLHRLHDLFRVTVRGQGVKNDALSLTTDRDIRPLEV